MLEKKEDIKIKVNHYCLDTFLQSGYKSVNMDDIAKTLGVSKRTLYEVFQSKDEMLIESLKIPINDFEEKLDDIALRMLKNDMQTFFENLFEVLKLTASHVTIFGESFVKEIRLYLPQFYESCVDYNNKRFDNFRNVIELGKSKGYFRPDIDSELLIKVLHYSMINILKSDSLIHIPLKIEDVIKEIFIIIFSGALTIETVAEFNKNIDLEHTN